MHQKSNKTKKVAIVGTGFVGSSYAYSLVNQGTVSELVLIDLNKERAEGEAQDLNHGVPFGSPMKIKAGDYGDCHDVDLVVITAGANQKPGETRLDLASKNAKIMRGIVKEIMASGFDGILVVASNPVDVMTHVAYEASGLPKEHVIGSGTILDTARFRYLLSDYFQVDSRNVHAYIVGEHGDSELPIWSHVTIGGLPLNVYGKLNNFYEDRDMQAIFENVRDAAYQIIQKKGATYYGIGMGLARLTKALLYNENSILTVSTYFQGEYDIDGVFMGIPAVVNANGVREILRLNLPEREQKQLENSADILRNMYNNLDK
ncbi:L-lactate dehydrogenase 2 [Halolactibacillus alkaliphilus]|uniref:L-lactate dehydrogenase n=1 Tax=Halolactibacillus alkaliphilus TaxID=442899 RepID=A0A511X1P2_9BACI|nr:L-lactate dehydrogenase [Halolactibacillus alkaliphilus]GEN56855.1 L-lactate dehydrogenase 2 [Halolactibacillus alkaliphilus]GGN71437.1 L-lactate dehydrogenase 2 [Halolactibacillus alkaliphilus]SFO82219.1 L-lactate dehydrogenase [Halolactibacillus alkaliphilus]